MKKLYRMWVLLMVLLGTLVPSVVMAAPEGAPTETPTKESFSPDHLKGRLGFGLVYNYDVPYGYVANLRWWFEDRTALDLLVGGNYTERQGYGFDLKPTTVPYWNFSLGLGIREIVAEPAPDVHVLAIQRAYFSSFLQQSANTSVLYKTQTQSLMAFVGIGFEAFIPFWRNLSIEGSVGAKFGGQWEQDIQIQNGYGAPDIRYETDYGNFIAGSNNDVTSLVGAGVHFYF